MVVPPAMVADASTPVNFGAIQNLTNGPPGSVSSAPVVNTVGSHVYVAWEEKPSSNQHVTTYFVTSADNGTTWGPIISFMGMPGGASSQTSAVQMASEGKYVFLTWAQGPLTAYAISSDFGGHFNQNGTLSGPTGTMSGEAVAACGTYAYFTWSDQVTGSSSRPILISVAHDTGSGTFTISSPLSISGSTSKHGEDEVACVGNDVFITWDSIFLTGSADNGVHFNTPQQIKSPGGSGGSLAREPMISTSMTSSGLRVYVTTPSNSSPDGSYQTWVIVCAPTTQVKSGVTMIVNNCATAKDLSYGYLSNAREVQITSSGNNVYITSRGQVNNANGTQQFIYVSTNAGATFTPPIALSPKLPNPENGFGGVTVYGSNVYVLWQHNTKAKGVQQMVFAASQDNGATWAPYQQVSNSTSGVEGYGDPSGGQGPMVSANSGHVFTVWQDNSTGVANIYFRTGTTTGSTTTTSTTTTSTTTTTSS
jgi:hypothetical protein